MLRGFYTVRQCWDWDDLYAVLGVLEGGVSASKTGQTDRGSTVGRAV